MNHRTDLEADGEVGLEEAEKKKVVDFNQVKEKHLEEKRRRTERIFFKNLIGVYSVIGQGKMQPVDLVDISEDGCSFQIPLNLRNPSPWPQKSKELPLRLYFSQDTYLEIFARIVNSRPSIEKNRRYVRYGCEIDKTVKSYAVYQLFVQFLKQYAVHAHRDLGNATAFYL